MLALEPLIVARLRDALPASWTVKGVSSDAGRRDPHRFASVLFVDGNVPDPKANGALVQTAWQVTLVVRRGDDAAAEIDAAASAAMQALIGWTPGAVSGRPWARLTLQRVTAPQYADDGLTGLELTFITSATFIGQP